MGSGHQLKTSKILGKRKRGGYHMITLNTKYLRRGGYLHKKIVDSSLKDYISPKDLRIDGRTVLRLADGQPDKVN